MHRVFPAFVSGKGAFGLLLVRLVVGAAFIFHGFPKIQKPFSWMGENADMPGALQALAAATEFGGGIALILGIVTPIAALLMAGVMAVAVFKVHVPAGHSFVSAGGPSYELAAVYLAVMILFLLMGPGAMSLDASLFQKKSG